MGDRSGGWRLPALAVAILMALAPAGHAYEAGAGSAPAPDRHETARLVWTTLIAIDHANRSGNYSVLRDIAAPAFRDANDPVRLSASFVNGCDYCMAAHTTLANMKRVPAEVVEALRSGTPLADPGLDALATLTRSIVETRGWPDEAATEAFFAAGYGTSEYLEVVVGVTMKTLSNYLNHAAGTPLDAAFQTAKWAA